MLGLLAVIFFYGLYIVEPRTFYKLKNAVVSLLNGEVEKKENEPEVIYEEALVAVEPNGTLYKDILIKHQIAAKKHGVEVIENEPQLENFIATNKLLVIEDGIGYTLDDMTHSYPYAVASAKKILEKIGLSFYTFSGDSSSIVVTSLTRTEATQNNLRRSNRNATRKESTHTRGVSFDISYIRYNGVKDWNYSYTKTLEGILAAMQAAGEIYVIKERHQNCFHITVRD